jgi:hypothetical protein
MTGLTDGVECQMGESSVSHDAQVKLLHADTENSVTTLNPDQRQNVLEELERILHGKRFHNSGRAKQFLQYIVERKLEGHFDDLKERTIGTELFQRPPDYSTGEDPVVRVHAGHVRRKLEQHYQDVKETSLVRIDLPLGSYAPEFHWQSEESVELPHVSASSEPGTEPIQSGRRTFPKSSVLIITLAVSAVLMIAITAARVKFRPATPQNSALKEFWAPALAAQQPVLFCLSNGVTYRPNQRLYEKYQREHPGTFTTITEKDNKPLPLDPGEKITFGDLELITEWGITRGDLETAFKLAAFFGKIGKPVDLRVETEYSFRDLRGSPAVLIGAFNNEWTMNLVSDLRYKFIEKEGIRIQDQGPPERFWPQLPGQSLQSVDYAIISRLIDPKTGQFTVIVGGLTSRGTEAAVEFISSENDLGDFLRSAPKNWKSMSLELVLRTDVTDGVSGPPHIVASNFW